jgi:hypothetical protein
MPIAGMAAAKSAIETAKFVANAVREYDKVDLKLKAVELTQQITELALENSELHQTISDLRKELETMKKRFGMRGKLFARDNVYYMTVEGVDDGPYCTRCFDVDGILVRMMQSRPDDGIIWKECPHCSILKK